MLGIGLHSSLLWSPYGIGQTIIFLPCGFFMATLWNRAAIIFLSCGFFLSSLWSPYVIGQTIVFLPCDFYLSFFFSSPNLSGQRLDVYHTSTQWCGLNANFECMFEMCCTWLAENTGHKKSPFWHHRTTLSRCIFAAEACIDNPKKVVKHRYLLHMSS